MSLFLSQMGNEEKLTQLFPWCPVMPRVRYPSQWHKGREFKHHIDQVTPCTVTLRSGSFSGYRVFGGSRMFHALRGISCLSVSLGSDNHR